MIGVESSTGGEGMLCANTEELNQKPLPLTERYNPATGLTAEPTASGIRLRLANSEDDIAVLADLAERAHAESAYSALPFAKEKVLAAGRRYLTRPNQTCMIMVERDGEPVGMLIGAVEAYLFSEAKGASVLTYYVAPMARGSLAAFMLLRAFRRWANQAGAVTLSVHVTSNVNKNTAHRFLTRMGLRLMGGNYLAALGPSADREKK